LKQVKRSSKIMFGRFFVDFGHKLVLNGVFRLNCTRLSFQMGLDPWINGWMPINLRRFVSFCPQFVYQIREATPIGLLRLECIFGSLPTN
jgi:hypothetical protein